MIYYVEKKIALAAINIIFRKFTFNYLLEQLYLFIITNLNYMSVNPSVLYFS